MKIAIIGSRGIPSNYGGFETLAEHLTANCTDNIKYTVYCSSKAYSIKLKEFNGAKLKYIPLDANGIQSIPYDNWSIIHAMRNSDILLILGVSGCISLPILKLFCNKPIIINIDGLEWKRDKWGRLAKWFYKLSEKVAIKNGNYIIADNLVIQNYVKNTYNKKSFLIPYGADHAKKHDLTKELLNNYSFLSMPYAFKVCRIEPENNVHIILEAFKNTSVNLVIIGNWQKNKYGQALYCKYCDEENIYLLDPIYDLNILDQFRSNCLFYVHGHSAGGTNPSLVEAMYLELPIIAFDINYNRETTNDDALYFKDVKDLKNIITNPNLIKEYYEIGRKMKKIADSKYTWSQISDAYSDVYFKSYTSK